MRIISCSLENFASYSKLDFTFTDQGLTLIQGATGSGKSTLCDAIPWILFGTTAKGGPVSDVLSWPGDEVTRGGVNLAGRIYIVRTRGPKPKDNDLYVMEPGHSNIELNKPRRGKDLNDTQRIINNLLGVDSELYLSGAYFHEFSQTAQFFTTTAKNRRAICEQIVDLSLAKKLQPAIAQRRKEVKISLDETIQTIRDTEYKLSQKKLAEKSELDRSIAWIANKTARIGQQERNILQFENNRADKVKDLQRESDQELKQDICKECGNVKIKSEQHTITHKNRYAALIDQEKSKGNPYVSMLETIEAEVNPFKAELKDFSKEIDELLSTSKQLNTSKEKLALHIDDIDLLQEVVSDYRSVSISNTIQSIESQANELLSKHFDAEIKVEFSIADADKLDVTIYKDSNQCGYTQLSKGQRCLLKLCFGIAVMRAIANHHGVRFDQIFFDEALSGLDEQMKTKAYGLLSTLIEEYESIFVVEHSEGFKTLFTNKFSVELINGQSQICQA